MPIKTSIIIPVFNEQNGIEGCINSLLKQSFRDFEIIIIDDGSTDKTLEVLSQFKMQSASWRRKYKILEQNHSGPGKARNLGVSIAKGEILVFVDADMEFEKKFLGRLIDPIIRKEAIGTFSKEEYLLNKENKWARFWNINLGRNPEKMHVPDYPETQPVFRAILRSEFLKAGGFDEKLGYTDDWSLSRKLGLEALNSPGAVFYHKNPDSLKEVLIQARWFGKNEFLTKNFVRKMYNLTRYSIILSIIKGTLTAVKIRDWQYLFFKITYDSAVFLSVLLSFFGEQKYK